MQEFFDVLNENGTYSGKVESREVCHKEGLWHRAVILFVINDEGKILLQKRSSNKKLWPNLWDLTAGGHVLHNELGYEAIIRESKEELNIEVNKNDMTYVGTFISTNIKGDVINRHFNEFFVVRRNVDISKLELQEEEVQDVRWFTKEEIINLINDGYKEITDKVECWQYLQKYLELKG